MPLSKEKDRERKRISNLSKGEFQPNSNLERYPAILEALVDPEKRVKLEKIYLSLKKQNPDLLKEVRYGVNGPTFDVVGELLEVTG